MVGAGLAIRRALGVIATGPWTTCNAGCGVCAEGLRHTTRHQAQHTCALPGDPSLLRVAREACMPASWPLLPAEKTLGIAMDIQGGEM